MRAWQAYAFQSSLLASDVASIYQTSEAPEESTTSVWFVPAHESELFVQDSLALDALDVCAVPVESTAIVPGRSPFTAT
jgi:hypothetical protein